MKRFPSEFSDLLSPYGMRVLRGDVGTCSLFAGSRAYYINLRNVVDRSKAKACAELLDNHLYSLLRTEQSKIPAESITRMKRNYSEVLPKTIRMRTALLRRSSSRSYQAAVEIGLLEMMRSDSFFSFAQSVIGLRLDRDVDLQVICYRHGDYAGPHNDHHPEFELMRDGFVDFHLMFANDAVAHQYLVFEDKGHFSRIVDINLNGAVSLYKLPFWHYTTPLLGKRGREREARRWLLLATFCVIKS
jgi:hypothetical protein